MRSKTLPHAAPPSQLRFHFPHNKKNPNIKRITPILSLVIHFSRTQVFGNLMWKNGRSQYTTVDATESSNITPINLSQPTVLVQVAMLSMNTYYAMKAYAIQQEDLKAESK